jgi:hypothetical protein
MPPTFSALLEELEILLWLENEELPIGTKRTWARGVYVKTGRGWSKVPDNRGTQKSELPSVPLIRTISDEDHKALQAEFTDKLTSKQADALDIYSSSTYKDINKMLRNGKVINGKEKILKNIDDALEKSPLPHATILYRGLHSGETSKLSSLEVGDSFIEKAYSSTSSSDTAFKRKVNLHIHVPAGYPAAPIPSKIDEKEFLLRRGTKYEVTGIEDDGVNKTINVRVVDSEMVPIDSIIDNETRRLKDAPPADIIKADAEK